MNFHSNKIVPAHVGTAALGCPAERSSAPAGTLCNVGISPAGKKKSRLIQYFLVLALIAFASLLPVRAQQEPASEPAKQTSETKKNNVAEDLAKESREAAGEEEEEENANLKHGKPVQWLARKIDWSVHGTHLLLSCLNFAVIVIVVFWAARKSLPAMFRNRTASIQQALQEARAASQDANRRLADIETRLRQLDVEIGQMQAATEKEGAAEEIRIREAAEEDIRKVVRTAEQEIAAAAKQARRELTGHTAGLALALARQQISVDSNTDQGLVRTFALGLTSHPSSPGSPRDDDNHGGKDGR